MFAMLHESPVHKAGNYLEGEWIAQTDHGAIRTRLHRDSYDNQSWLQTDAWTPNGWAMIIRQDGYVLDLPSPYAKDHELPAIEKLVNGMVTRQQDLAQEVLAA